MPGLFKHNANQDIYRGLNKCFEHPGKLLFRGRELVEVNKYALMHHLDASLRILDLGCGEGFIGNMLFNKIDVGLDLVFQEAQKAQTLAAYKNVVITDAKDMSFRDNYFDVIFSNSVIEHIKEIDQVLKEISRVLSRRGLFIFTVPSDKFGDYLYFNALFKKIGLSLIGRIYSWARNRQLNHFNLSDHLKWYERLRKYSLEVTYRKYYLSSEDIYECDKICLLLRLTKPLGFIHKVLTHKFYNKVTRLLSEEENFEVGAGLLIVTMKCPHV